MRNEHRPAGPGPFPAVYAVSPYGKHNVDLPAIPAFRHRETGDIAFYVIHGYAYVHADTRGTGHSTLTTTTPSSGSLTSRGPATGCSGQLAGRPLALLACAESVEDEPEIQGPSISYFNASWLTTFLTDAKASGTLPDVLSWHELGGSSSIAADVASARSIEASLGISSLPIAIEEYATTSEVGVPGSLVGYIAKFERAGVSNAELAFWNHYGTLGDLLTDTGRSPNAAYWLYRWYGSMTGNMVTTVPPAQTGLDGAASVNAAGNQVSVIFGGGSGSTAVTANGLSALSAFGATAHVVLEQTVSAGRTTAVAGPSIISSGNYTISGGSITVPINSMSSANGYHLLITPGSSSALSGTYVIKNVNSGLALDTSGGGTAEGTLAVQATASGSSTQNWTLIPEGSNFYEIENAASGQLLGVSDEGIADGADALIWANNGTSDHLWQIVSAGSGQYKIENYNSGLLLGVQNESKASGAQVLQWSDNGTPDHLWTVTAS